MATDSLRDTVEAIASECLAVRIRLLNRTVTGIFDDALRPLGVKISQLNVLMVVARRGPIAPGDLAGRLNMEKSTLSRNVERLKTRGWIQIGEGDSGRRQVLKLTASGRRLIERAYPHWQKAQSETEDLLGVAGARSLKKAGNAVWAKLS